MLTLLSAFRASPATETEVADALREGPTLPGARLEDIDFSTARLHAPNFEGAKLTDAWFYDADISGDLEGLRLNGVEVAPLVVAELERRFPERAKLRAADPEALADAWAMIEDRWANYLCPRPKAPGADALRASRRRVELR